MPRALRAVPRALRAVPRALRTAPRALRTAPRTPRTAPRTPRAALRPAQTLKPASQSLRRALRGPLPHSGGVKTQARRPTGRGEMPGRLKVLLSPSRSDYLIYGRAGGQPLGLSPAPSAGASRGGAPSFDSAQDENRSADGKFEDAIVKRTRHTLQYRLTG
jgi:hypothetical protein